MKHLLTWLQSNHSRSSFKREVERLVKITVTLLCIWFIFRQISYEDLNLLPYIQSNGFFLVVFLVTGMMVVNWLLEAEKWRISLPHESLNLRHALAAVLAGLALNWIIPFTLGDAGGRLASVRNYRRSLHALLLNRAIMIFVTAAYGVIAVLFYFKKLNSFTFAGVILAGFLISTFYLKLNSKKVNGDIPNALVKKIFQLTFLRYLIFSLQFCLLIKHFNPSLAGVLVVLGVGWIFLFRSVVPSLLGNFGVREASAVIFFQPYVAEMSLVLLPCMLIWLINTVIPSLAGAVAIFKLKINIAQ